MDDLDKQLAELALLNKRELPPNPNTDNSGTMGRKVGPAVPPKPKKPQPQVPKSSVVRQPSHPSYSSPIQQTPLYSNLPSAVSSRYSSSTSLTSNIPYHSPDSSYANLPSQASESQYSNTAIRSSSSMSNASSLPRGVSYSPKPPESDSAYLQHYGTANSNGRVYGGDRNEVMYSNMPPLQHGGQDNLVYSNLIHSQRGGAGVYNNVPMANRVFPSGDELPPPPPPLETMTAGLNDYATCNVNTNLPPPPDELLPPPSPVSSSYSELRRATQPGQDFHSYGMGSKSSSTYESIYEPINPRPPSQMSSRSNYSLYGPYVSGVSSAMTGPSESASCIGMNKEQEVDSLTDLLVQGMGRQVTALYEEDVYGICFKCQQKIVGENSGCTAMDRLFHVMCFTCHHCAINLQGKPFYSIKGQPYCEEDYLNTLEKCCMCQKPILDRILRATGKPYHPACFCCVVCGKSLDGIPFTVDVNNRVHCIEDFHKMYAPKCWVCKDPIMPEPGEAETVRVVALDHSFHVQCYKCEDCGLVLSSEKEGRGCYPLDGHLLCKSCNAIRIQRLTKNLTTEL